MRIRKLLAGMLAAAMLASLLPSALAAAPETVKSTEQAKTELGLDLYKEAGDMAGRASVVTLGINAPLSTTPVAVEFVLDVTSSLFVDQTSGQLLVEEWGKTIYNTFKGQNVYAGLTVFGNDARELAPMELVTDVVYADTDDLAWLGTQNGTNVQAGIKAGIEALNKLSTDLVASENRYLVLITDGGSFYWLDDEGNAVNNSYYQADGTAASLQNNDAAEGGYEALTSLTDLLADSTITNATATYGDASAIEPLAAAVQAIKADGSYTNFEKGVCLAAKELDNLGDNKLITVGYPYYKDDTGLVALTKLADEFITYAEDKSVLTVRTTLNETAGQLESIMDEIYGCAVNVVVPAGSVITDEIGKDDAEPYDFKLDTDQDIKLFVGATLLGSGKLDPDTKSITFKRNDADFLTLQYYPEGTRDNPNEHFTATLHQDLLRSEGFHLTYTVTMVDWNHARGTHTAYTNIDAWLTLPGDDENPVGDSYLFPVPDVTYRISGGGGGGEDIPDDDVPLGELPELNTSDHFAYIIGRDDGLVHPLAEINRAEVATIFFRMLTDASRNQLWTTTNPYVDVDAEDWFNNAISTLTTGGVVEGKPGNRFDPDASITRAEFATIAVRFFGGSYEGEDLFTDISGHWANNYINRAAVLGLINGRGDGTFDPDAPITRAEAMAIVNRTLGRKPVADMLLDDMITWPDNQDESAWYYADVQEATNSHDFDVVEVDDSQVESWTELLPVRDWAALEKEWSDANSSENPGEVLPDYVPTEG